MNWKIFAVAALCVVTQRAWAEGDAFQTGLDAYLAGKYEQAFAQWQPLAETGDKVASFNLGVLYARGLGVERDLEKSIDWYRRSAEAGYAPAQFNLGSALMEGSGVAADKAEAARWWAKAADQDYSHALFNLATLHLRGDGVPRDEVKARELYQRAAKLGDARAQRVLDKLTPAPAAQSGPGTEKTIAKAAPSATAITQAPSEAETPETPSDGATWVRQQANTNFTVQILALTDREAALSFVARHRLRDVVLITTEQKGRRWYKAIHGSFGDRAAAISALNEMKARLPEQSPWIRQFTDVKAEMTGVERLSDYTVEQRSQEQSTAVEDRPAATPVPEAPVQTSATGDQQLRLGQVAFNGQRYDEAFRQWSPLAERGVADAQYGLAFMYESGWGVERDYEKAFRWYRAAAQQGHVRSQFNLGLLYRNGQGVVQNEALGLYWIQNAADNEDPRAQEFLRRETKRNN